MGAINKIWSMIRHHYYVNLNLMGVQWPYIRNSGFQFIYIILCVNDLVWTKIFCSGYLSLDLFYWRNEVPKAFISVSCWFTGKLTSVYRLWELCRLWSEPTRCTKNTSSQNYFLSSGKGKNNYMSHNLLKNTRQLQWRDVAMSMPRHNDGRE